MTPLLSRKQRRTRVCSWKRKMKKENVSSSTIFLEGWWDSRKEAKKYRTLLQSSRWYDMPTTNWHLPSTSTSWQIDGETVETMTDFIFGGSKIIANGDWNREIKRRLLLGRKVMTNLDSILKSRDITLPAKILIVKAMVFPVVMYGYESWTIKKAECWKIDTSSVLNYVVGEDSWESLGLQGDQTSQS